MSTPSSPRPILKKRASSRYLSVCGSLDKDLSLLRKTVQFSPERDYQIFQAHSPDVYDRSPLKVPANHCELPERGYKGSPSRGRERRLASSGSERIFPSSPERAMSMHELVKALPVFEDDDDEMDLKPLHFRRPNTPAPCLGSFFDDDGEDIVPVLSLGHAHTLPPLVSDRSESDESETTSPPPEPSELCSSTYLLTCSHLTHSSSAWTTSQNADAAFTLRGPQSGALSEKPIQPLKYPKQLSLSSTSQPAVFQKRPRLAAQRHKIPFELTQVPAHEDDVFADTSPGVMCESWAVSDSDNISCLGGF